MFGRALHPELFNVHKSQTVQRGDYKAQIDITSAGHILTWRYRGLTLTEVACSAQHPLPEKRRLLSYRLRGQRNDRVECRGGVVYQMSFQLETVGPEFFWAFQDQLAKSGQQDELLFSFDSSGRMALGAVSYVHFETRARSLHTRSFHTFPDDCAIVRTQSTFELP